MVFARMGLHQHHILLPQPCCTSPTASYRLQQLASLQCLSLQLLTTRAILHTVLPRLLPDLATLRQAPATTLPLPGPAAQVLSRAWAAMLTFGDLEAATDAATAAPIALDGTTNQ